jgi:hypothetical protein
MVATALCAIALVAILAVIAFHVYRGFAEGSRMELTFKDSPPLTKLRRERIRNNLWRCHEYLESIHLESPTSLPPIGVRNGRAPNNNSGRLPDYGSSILLGTDSLDDPMQETLVYIDYSLEQLISKQLADPWPFTTMRARQDQWLPDQQAASGIASYLNWSFWNRKPPNEAAIWGNPLWEIRTQFGKEYTDNLASRAFKEIMDTPEDGADQNFELYFYRKLKTADRIVENDGTKWPQVQAILTKKQYGLNLPLLR